MTTETPCEKARLGMLLAGSGELPELERQELARHLAACPACRRVQSENATLVARVRALPARTAPALSVSALEAQASRTLPFRAPLILAAAAALVLALLGAGQWLMPIGNSQDGAPARNALLDEWQFWMVSSLSEQTGSEPALPFIEGWTERDFARHLLVLEGLLPDEEAAFEEDYQDPTPGALPPISLRDYNIPELLRS